MKIGFFIEGQTERIFLIKFLEEYLGGEQNFSRTEFKSLGKEAVKLIGERKYPAAEIYILIFDCGGDGSVFSVLNDRADKLITKNNYDYLVVLRDLYNFKRNEKRLVVNKFRDLFSNYSYQSKIRLVLSIMEIESWFLADYSLFAKINSILTPDYIQKKLGYDLINTDPEIYNHPASIINKIYGLVGSKYKKRKDQSYQISTRIDFDILLCLVDDKKRLKSFKYFIDVIDSCIEIFKH